MSKPKRALVGVCGFAEAQGRIFRDMDLLEVQKTFYQPPRPATAEKWRDRASTDFVFTLKAWQLITHDASSPTYKRLTEKLTEKQRGQAGSFRWNPTTRSAWARTQEIADALDASGVVFQTPKRFTPKEANLSQLYRFFESIDRHGRRMIFEPRGEAWDDQLLRRLVADLELVHAVDPFLRRPVGRGLRYYRLHGRPQYNYHYRYADADLTELEGFLSGAWPNWILFNNDSMADDARRLMQRLGHRQ